MIISKLLVLAIVCRRKEAYGYEIYKDLLDWRANTWTRVRPGSIYHAIAQLEKDGHIRRVKSEEGKRGSIRTVFTLTFQGSKALEDWLKEALASLEPEEYSTGLAFRNLLSQEAVEQIARTRLTQLKETGAFLRTLPTAPNSPIPSEDQELVKYWTDFIDFQTNNAQQFVNSNTRERSKQR